MIDHDNYLAVKEYLRYQAEVLQCDPLTVSNHWSWLKHLLCWADEVQFDKSPTLRPVYPRYLLSVQRPNGTALAAVGVRRACLYARMFFDWLHLNHARTHPNISPAWISTIHPPKMAAERRKDHQAVSLETVRQLMKVEAASDDVAMKRDKAAAAFLFLSGMRATAFTTLPISCVNLHDRTVMQYPTMGVNTKNKKSAITRLLEIPDLLEVVSEWDEYVRKRLPPATPWYALTEISFGVQELSEKQPGTYRIVGLGRNIKALFRAAGLTPHSSHKFRHGHAVYGLKLAKEVSDLKAVSMNLMHSSMGITDAIYAVLSDKDMQTRIARLGQSSGTEPSGISQKKIEEVVQKVLDELQR